MTKPGNALRWAFTGSALINAFVLSSAWFARPEGLQPIIVRIANAIAAPPGYIARMFIRPSEHTLSAYFTALGLSLLCSFLFYAGVCWLVIRAGMKARAARGEKDGAGTTN